MSVAKFANGWFRTKQIWVIEVGGRSNETQLQVGENSNYLGYRLKVR